MFSYDLGGGWSLVVFGKEILRSNGTWGMRVAQERIYAYNGKEVVQKPELSCVVTIWKTLNGNINSFSIEGKCKNQKII